MKRAAGFVATVLAAVGVIFLMWDAYNREHWVTVACAVVCEWMLLGAIWQKSKVK